MSLRCLHFAVVGAAAVLLPVALMAQMDPTANPGVSPYPQSPQGMNQPAGPPGSNAPNGSQTIQSGSSSGSLGAPGETGQQMADKQFLRSATEMGIADVKMGELAEQKGEPDVKTLAQQLVDDHTAINKDMGNTADALGVMLPKRMSKDDQAEYEKLNGLSGKDFDTEYLTYVAKKHWLTLHSFYLEASSASDPGLETEVTKAMLTMRQHAGMIANTATAAGVTLPPRPPRPANTVTAKQ
jgi:putative membrane protein